MVSETIYKCDKSTGYKETVDFSPARWNGGFTTIDFMTEKTIADMALAIRPASEATIMDKVQRLVLLKPLANDSGRLKVVLESILEDISGCSEYILKTVCNDFRMDTSNKFFPDYAVFVTTIKNKNEELLFLNKRLNEVYAKKISGFYDAPPPAEPEKTQEEIDAEAKQREILLADIEKRRADAALKEKQARPAVKPMLVNVTLTSPIKRA
jgi:hypothetical protein